MKRATEIIDKAYIYKNDFNPRPHEEGDMYQGYIGTTPNGISIHALMKRATLSGSGLFLPVFISIHALMKRATIYILTFQTAQFYFNPRPHEEGDCCLLSYPVFHRLFQSTPS